MSKKHKSAIVVDRDNWQAEAEKLRAINRDLLAALEGLRRRTEIDPTNLPAKMFAGEIAAMCTDAIYKAKLPA